MARLAQYERADDGARASALGAFHAALSELRQAATIPILKSYYLMYRAQLERITGKTRRAHATLMKAEDCARYALCLPVRMEVHRARARMLADDGQSAAARDEALLARNVAAGQDWAASVKQIGAEFHLDDLQPLQAPLSVHDGSRASASTNLTAGSVAQVNLNRYLEALLQLSLASAQARSPDDQAKIALDQMVRLLGAERAFLFLADPSGDGLVMKGGRDSGGQELLEIEGFSRSVVERVRGDRKAWVLCADESSEATAPSQSMVAFNLRSIMAAPILIGDRLLGVVYLDSRLAKGVFTHDDLSILQALSNHIAVALETSRTTQLELERKSLEKDLELTAVLQSLMLPKSSRIVAPRIKVAAHTQAAAQSGGDWWWFSSGPGGDSLLLLGDVTGHGAGAAMVTALIAGNFNAMSQVSPVPSAEAVMRSFATSLRETCEGKYWMTLAAVEIDAETGVVRMTSAGAPPILVVRADEKKIESLRPSGTALGDEDQIWDAQETTLRPGDRLFFFTDGVSEMNVPAGERFNLRQLRDLVLRHGFAPIDEARAGLIADLEKLRGGVPLSDDMTFGFIELAPGAD
jgi:serine phosphatase RsbU (regulator of sigma subunit)